MTGRGSIIPDNPIRIALVPISLREAKAFIVEHHRHNGPPAGWKFGVGVTDGEKLVGVGIASRPIAKQLDDGRTLEVSRTCTDGTPNANSMLYGALTRAAAALGFTRVITYTLAEEPGSSLRAAGWVVDESRVDYGRIGWHRHPRESPELDMFGNERRPLGAKIRWVKWLKGTGGGMSLQWGCPGAARTARGVDTTSLEGDVMTESTARFLRCLARKADWDPTISPGITCERAAGHLGPHQIHNAAGSTVMWAAGRTFWTVSWDFVGGDCGRLPGEFDSEEAAAEVGIDWADAAFEQGRLDGSLPDDVESGDDGWPCYRVFRHEVGEDGTERVYDDEGKS